MLIKKTGGVIYGAKLTANEQRALDIEVKRQLAEAARKHYNEIDAIILWELSDQFGFGPKRLREFYNRFDARVHELLDHYELGTDDMSWLCSQKLKDKYGIDLEEWAKENERLT